MDTRNPVRFLQAEVARLRDENRDLKEELGILRSSVRGLASLQDLIQRLQPRANVMELLDDLLAAALAVLDASDGSLLLVDDDTGELVFAVVHGQARNRLTGYRLPSGQGIAGWVVASKKPHIVEDARRDPRFTPLVDETFNFRTQSLACVPLLDGGRVLGVIEALNKTSGREFSLEDHDLLVVVAQLVSFAILRAEAYTEAGSPS